MIRRALTLPALLLALVCAAPAPAAAAAPPAFENRIIVQWRSAPGDLGRELAASPERIAALKARSNLPLLRGWNIGGSLSVLLLERPESGAELAATIAALRADPEVELAAVDKWVRPHYVPNDPLFSAGHPYQGQTYDYQWYLKSAVPSATRTQLAWDLTRGGASAASSDVVVAVLDSGVRFDHPDLAGKLLPGWDFISGDAVANDGDGWDDDPSDPGDYITAQDLTGLFVGCGGGDNEDQPLDSTWHGTRVAGLIAAGSDNNTGMTGAAFHVRVLPVRVLGKCGGYVSDVIAGMYWAAGLAPPPPLLSTPHPPLNTRPAQVINMSLGSDDSCAGTDDTARMYRVAAQQVTAAGSLIVASAGNSGADVGSPAGCTHVFAVAGLRHAGTKVGYSSLGTEVDLAAPAGNCVLVGPGDPCLYALNTLYNTGTTVPAANGYSTPLEANYGTSFSAPLVSAAAALMFSLRPDLTPAEVSTLLRSSARPFPGMSDTMPQPPACVLPAVQAEQPFECICNTEVCGAGMLDTHAAVLAAQGAPPPPANGGGNGGGGGGGGDGTPLLLLVMLLLTWRFGKLRRARALRQER